MKTKLLFYAIRLVLIVGLSFVFSNASGQVASWTYGTIGGGNINIPTANTGTGTSSVIGTQSTPQQLQGMNPAGTGCGAADGGATDCWHFANFEPGTLTETNGVQYNASTVGYSNITFTWDQRMSNTAPNTVRLQYTTNGVAWTNFSMTTLNTTICSGSSITTNGCFKTDIGDEYRRISVNLSAISALNNNANFGIRLLAAFDPAAGQFRQSTNQTLVATNTGTWRFDNVKVAGALGVGPTNTVISPSATVTICPGTNATLRFLVTGGTGPFTVVYKDNFSNNFTVNNYTSGTSFNVSPSVNTTYTLVSIVDANAINGVVSISPTKTVNLYTAPSLPIAPSTYAVTNFTSCSGAVALPANFPPASFNVTGTNYTAVYTNTATSLTFTFPLSAATGSMPFTVKITNLTTTCTWTSPIYNFTRYVSPSITTPPSTTVQTTCSGTSFSALTVVAAGSGLSYQWYSYDGVTTIALTSVADIASGSQTASYTPQSTVLGTLRYYVRVSGYCSPAVNSAYSGNHTVTVAAVAGTVAGAQTICTGTTPGDLVLSGQTGSVIKWQKANDVGFTSGVTDIASTATTLLGTTIGTLSQTTYFIAYVQNGTCTLTTPPIQILIKTTTYTIALGWSNGAPDSTTTAIFSDNYSSIGDLNACSVQVNSGNVVFNANHTLTVQNNITLSGGTLTFENDASLIQINTPPYPTNPNIGNITYKRDTWMRRYDYTYWGSPVELQNLAVFSPNTLSDKYLSWDANLYTWNSHNAVATPMDAGRGYAIRSEQTQPVGGAAWTGIFNGKPNNGDYQVQLYRNIPTNDLNILGNPYPSAISADAFMDGNAGPLGVFGIGTTISFWTHNTIITANNYNAINDFAYYNRTGTTAASPGPNNAIPDGYIGAGQGFIIKAITSGIITFRNTMRVPGNGTATGPNTQFFRTHNQSTTSVLQKNRLWLDLTSADGAIFKQLLVGYIQNATNAYEDGFDGEIMNVGSPVNFYSVVDAKKLAIQGRAIPFDNNDEVPIGITLATTGTYTINLSRFDGLFENQSTTIYLEDKLLNIFHDLRLSAYSFLSEVGTFNDRFVLRFTNPNLLSTIDPVFNDGSILIYKNQTKDLVIHSEKITLKSVQLFDAIGRLIDEKNNISANEVKFSESNIHKVIIVKIQLSNNQIISKKFMN